MCFRVRIGRIRIRTGPARNSDCILGFVKIQRFVLFQSDRLEFDRCHVYGVLPALQQFKFRIHLFDDALRVGSNKILQHDGVTRLCHSKIRFGGDDHSERLQVRRDIEDSSVVIVKKNFAEIDRPALGCNRPENVRQIFGTET